MPFKFYIQDLYDRTEVTEPRGAKDITSVLERDFAVHGVFFKYSDGTLKLGFSCESKTLLEAAYQMDGSEAYYLFEIDQAKNDLSTFTTIFSGELDFKTRDFPEDYFNIDVNEINEIDKIKNRSNLKINLNKGLSLDGIDLSNINYDDTIYSLATKNFKQLIVKNEGETLVAVQSTAATSASFLYANFGFPIVESDELEKYRKRSTAMNTSVITGDLLTLEKAGALDMNFDYNFDLNLTEDQGSGTTNYFATLSIKFDPPIGGVLDEIALDTENAGAASPFDTTHTFLGDVDQTIFAEAGTKIWLELEIQQTSTGTTQMTCELDITKFDITITDKIGIPGTQAQWYHLHDALNKNLNYITGEYDYLFSDLLGDLERGYSLDGCLAGMRITNGFRVRQINDTNKAPIFSFKDFISNINTIASVGYGIEELESPLGLGNYIMNINTIDIYDILTINVISDLTSLFDVGSEIGFYDNEFIYGVWPVTSITYDGVYDTTLIGLNVTGNTGLSQAESLNSQTVYLTSNKTTSFRDRLRLDKWEHFYGNNELIDLGVVQEYSEQPFDDILYNELNIKFSKFSNDEEKSTTLEEIHTESGWGLPLTKSDKRLSLVLQWIGSTHLFNESRERIFSRKPTTSHVLDNNIFFCDKAEKTGVYTVSFNAGTDKITMPADAYENVLNGSDFFSISDAVDVANNGIHQVDITQQVIFDITNNDYDVPVLSSLDAESNDEVTITHVEDTQKLFKPEANDKLSSSSGITRPTYIMNQRRTMKRFLISWGRYVSSVLAYLVDSANVTIQNLFFINNGDFSGEIDTSQLTSDCLMGDNSGASIREADDINTLALGNAKFKPNIIKGTVKICDEDFDRIKDAHKNRLDSFAILADASECSSPIRSDVAFIHQTGIFDITIVCGFDNVSSTTAFDYLLWNIGIGAEHGFTVLFGNSFTSIEGQVFFSIGIPSSSATSAISVDVRSKLNDRKRHTLRFVGSGSLLAFTIDGELIDMITPGFTSGGATNPIRDLFIGAATVGSHNHIGLYESVVIKNGAGEEIVKFNFTEQQGNTIVNEGDSAPGSTDASYAILPTFSNDLNYGYLTMTSPNDKTVSGWLMKMKRNPVDRIAKIELLERYETGTYNFSGIEKLTIPGIPDFERTSTCYFKAFIKSGTKNDLAYLLNNDGGATQQRGLSITGYNTLHADANKLLIKLVSDDASNNQINVITQNPALSASEYRTIEVWYDGSSIAAGITISVNGSPFTVTTLVDNLSASTLSGNNGFVVGRIKDESTGDDGAFNLQSLEFTIDDIKEFETNCPNAGDDSCPDLSGQNNDGIIDRSGTPSSVFYTL